MLGRLDLHSAINSDWMVRDILMILTLNQQFDFFCVCVNLHEIMHPLCLGRYDMFHLPHKSEFGDENDITSELSTFHSFFFVNVFSF